MKDLSLDEATADIAVGRPNPAQQLRGSRCRPGTSPSSAVGILIDYDDDDGNIEADFERGDFQITCPLVVFSLLNSPPAK